MPDVNKPRIFRPEPGDPGRPKRGMDDDMLRTQSSIFRDDLLVGQTVLITGAGSGMGKAAAFLAAKLGANVAICGRDQAKLESTTTLIRDALKQEVLAVPTNIRDPEAVEALIGKVSCANC